MSSLYIHIPYCHKACHYCDFHFTTNVKEKTRLIRAIAQEIRLRTHELTETSLQTVYFGGGTPSILNNEEIQILFEAIQSSFIVNDNAEITIEVNPEDVTESATALWQKFGINRISLGVQSIWDDELRFMNRNHNANETLQAFEILKNSNFTNISVDVIYGNPNSTVEKLNHTLETLLQFKPNHFSCYALTVEPKTALDHQLSKNKFSELSDDQFFEQFKLINKVLETNGYEAYEISNYGLPHCHSKHNSNYWSSGNYLGVGPSAHSKINGQRSYNLSQNAKYVSCIENGRLACETEFLSEKDILNEFIMTQLRTSKGLNLNAVEKNNFWPTKEKQKVIESYATHSLVEMENNVLRLTLEGKFLSNKIISDLMV